MLVPSRYAGHHARFRMAFMGDPRARPMGAGRDLYGLRKDGSEIPIEIGLNPLNTPEGSFVLSSVADITERKRAERENQELLAQLQKLNIELEARVAERTSELTAALREREVLLQEIHHRVKNNLQVISSLISMQVRRLDQGSSRDALEHCQTRVQAIALIHEKLYQSQDYGRVPFSDYARSLAGNVFWATGVSPRAVSLELQIEDLPIAVDKAIPCGLILNELITNSMKHAFSDGRQGVIRVELGRVGDGLVSLAVNDNGVGLLDGFDIQNSDALGLQLVCTLAEQLDAKLEVKGDEGTSFRLTFAVD
jgi:two-component sensor histidine kinase